MGRGDKKTKKGKIFSGSFGNVRPHKVTPKVTPNKEVAEVEAKPKKARVAKVKE